MAQIKIADVLFAHNGRILLVQQAKPSVYGLWGLPGGHVDRGETYAAAAQRELAEELGVIPGTPLGEPIVHIERSDEGSLRIATFVIRGTPGRILLNTSELMGVGWFTLQELRAMHASLRSPWLICLAEDAVAC